jgi:Na+-driven multidrug efflux pump
VGYGAVTASDTLASQAFGAGEYTRVGRVTYRGMAIMSAISVPIAALWCAAGPLLHLLGQDPEVATEAGRVCALLIPALLPSMWTDVLDKHFHAVGLTLPTLIVVAVMVAVNAALGRLLILSTPLGLYGAPVSTSLCSWLQFALTAAYFWRYRRVHGALAACWNLVAGAGRRLAFALTCGRCGVAAGGYGRVPVVAEAELASPPTASARVAAPPSPSDSRRADGGDSGAAAALPAPAPSQAPDPAEGQSADGKPEGEVETAALVVGAAAADDAAAAGTKPPREEPLEVATMEQFEASVGIPFTVEVFCTGWREYLSLAVYGALNSVMEWGLSEAQVAIAGYVSVAAQASQSILSTFSGAVCFMGPLSLSIASAVRVGHHLGECDAHNARRSARVSMLICAVYMLVNVVTIMGARSWWVTIFSDDPAVVDLVRATQPMLLLYSTGDAVQGLCSGVLRGASQMGGAGGGGGGRTRAGERTGTANCSWLSGLTASGTCMFAAVGCCAICRQSGRDMGPQPAASLPSPTRIGACGSEARHLASFVRINSKPSPRRASHPERRTVS